MKENNHNIQEEDINELVIDSLLEKPITFSLDGRFFYIYPPSLGVSLMAANLYKKLDINGELLLLKKEFEFVRVAIEHREDVLRLIAIHSFKNRKNAILSHKVYSRIKELSGLDAGDLATIMIQLAEWGTFQERFIKHFDITYDQEQRKKISEFKKGRGGSVTLGGRSIYGSLVDSICERYGWSVEYVLWGVSATTVNMMFADSVTSMYLSKEDEKSLGISTDGKIIKMGDLSALYDMRNKVEHKR